MRHIIPFRRAVLGFFLALGSQALDARDFPAPSALPVRTEIPDPLTMWSGHKITSRTGWEWRRRPELRALFAEYMYGSMPPKPAGFRATVDAVYPDALGGKATLKLVSLRLGEDGAPVQHLMVVIPNTGKDPVPAFIGLSFARNHQILADPRIPFPEGADQGKGARESERGGQSNVWAVEETINRGYAFASFFMGDVEPDRPDAKDGIRAWDGAHGKKRHDWGAIAAWAWGFHRAMDYLETDPRIDAKRVAYVGHSRNGKAALLAGATDQRAALIIPLQAGCGGTAPSRTQTGETVGRINTSFPHWFNAKFKEFNTQPERLPFDQDCLIAMCAPRPVLLANAVEDTWANPPGQFEMLKLAAPVYRLYGRGDLETAVMPPPYQLSPGRLGYFIRPGKHSMTAGDWKIFLDYADRWLK
jgi:hypothetical protein